MPLDLEQLPTAPHLVPVFKPTLAGVDFLNLRQVNLDLMGECIPGTNNATKRVRAYSVISWIYWIYPKLLEKLGRPDANSEELILFREKVESLFVWSHQLGGIAGMPGISAKVPPMRNGKVDLRFAAWKRSRVNTSLEAAVQYGPSLLDLGGLGLIHKIAPGIYVCNQGGRKLAKALDDQLRKSPAYGFLTNLSLLSGTEEQASALLPYWLFEETSSAEAHAFQLILWSPAHVGENTNRGRRAGMIELILKLLSSTKEPMDLDEIRQHISLPALWHKDPLPDGMLRQSRSWLVLQLRQLQRFALESMMSWVESQLLAGGHQTPDQLVTKAWEEYCEMMEVASDISTRDALAHVHKPIKDLNSFQKLVGDDPEWFSPWDICSQLAESVAEGDDLLLFNAFYSLLLLKQCQPFLEADKLLSCHLERGGSARVSLAQWFRVVDRLIDRPCLELLDWTLKTLVISQHFAVGTQRFDGEKIRLRMILDEDGLETLVGSPWQPGLTPDRLAALLSLLECCGLVRNEDDAYAAS
jgi:hypothetical protein